MFECHVQQKTKTTGEMIHLMFKRIMNAPLSLNEISKVTCVGHSIPNTDTVTTQY